MLRYAAVLVCLLAALALGCGGDSQTDKARTTAGGKTQAGKAASGDSEADKARAAAESYLHDFLARDGDAVCDDMTEGLRRAFVAAVTPGHPEVRGMSCSEILTTAFKAIPAKQFDPLKGAKVDDVRVDGGAGSFVYRLRKFMSKGKVAREDGTWKVSCCVPGQEA